MGDYDVYNGDTGREPNTPPYDMDLVIGSDANQAILTTKPRVPLTPRIIKNMRSKVEIHEAPGPRINSCRTQCLYNIKEDPSEKNDVKDEYPEIYEYLAGWISRERLRLKPSLNKTPDPKGIPENCNNLWYTWEEPMDNNPECSAQYAAPI